MCPKEQHYDDARSYQTFQIIISILQFLLLIIICNNSCKYKDKASMVSQLGILLLLACIACYLLFFIFMERDLQTPKGNLIHLDQVAYNNLMDKSSRDTHRIK